MTRWFCAGIAVLLFSASLALAVTGGGEIVYQIEGMAGVLFSHEAHVIKAKKRCSECHYGLYTNRAEHKVVGMEGMRKGKSCGACHDGKKVFGVVEKQHCEKCHTVVAPK